MLLNISFLTQIIWVQLTTRGCQVQPCVLFINLSRFCNMHYALCNPRCQVSIMESKLNEFGQNHFNIDHINLYICEMWWWYHWWHLIKYFIWGYIMISKSFLLKLKVLRILIFPASILELFPSFYAENFFPSNYPIIELLSFLV